MLMLEGLALTGPANVAEGWGRVTGLGTSSCRSIRNRIDAVWPASGPPHAGVKVIPLPAASRPPFDGGDPAMLPAAPG